MNHLGTVKIETERLLLRPFVITRQTTRHVTPFLQAII